MQALFALESLRNNELCFLNLMDILNWMQKPKKVWRVVCFVSYVVGLVCYALSSCFHDLLGKWTTRKMLVYIFVSFIICLVFVFSLVKAPRGGSSSPSLKLHSFFFGWLTTTIYSYFFEEKVKGKPDVFGLLSTAAFAIMSLGLSRISCFGFENDFLGYFFTLLVLELMKINFWFVVVGGSFLYVVLHYNLFYPRIIRDRARPPSNHNYSAINVDIDLPQAIVNVDPNLPQAIVNVDPNLSQAIANVAGRIVHPQAHATRVQVRKQFMGHIVELKKESRNAIDTISKHVDKYIKADVMNEDQIPVQELEADDNLVADAFPSEMIEHLRDTGWKMVLNGLEKEFYHMYTSFRKEFLKECLRTLGLQVDELNVDDVDKMDNIEKWIKSLNVAVRVFFPNERRLCDLLFLSSSTVFQSSFSTADFTLWEVCKELNSHLLRFVKTLATENHSHLPHVIISKALKTLNDLLPNYDSLFYNQLFSTSLRNEAADTFEELKRLVPPDEAESHNNAVVSYQDPPVKYVTVFGTLPNIDINPNDVRFKEYFSRGGRLTEYIYIYGLEDSLPEFTLPLNINFDFDE